MAIDISRRRFVAASSATVVLLGLRYAEEVRAGALPFVLPALVAGLISLWTFKVQNARDQARFDWEKEQAKLNREYNEVRFRWEIEQARRQEEHQLLLERIRNAERAGQAMYGDMPFVQKMFFEGGEGANLGIAADCDKRGTYLAVESGQIGIERGKFRGLLTNQEAVDAGAIIYSSGDPVPVPVRAPHGVSRADAKQWKRAIEEKKRLAEGTFDTYFSLGHEREYSRGLRVTRDGADLQSVTVLPVGGERKLEWHFRRI